MYCHLTFSDLLMDIGIVQVIQLTILGDPVIKGHDGRAALDETGAGLRVLNKLELCIRDSDSI